MSSAMMMKSQVCPIGLSPLPANRGMSTRVAAVKQETRQGTQSTSTVEEIYIGFPKGDYAPRAGRKGRVVKDDPKKYPGREDLGFFLGAVGGWAGGEAGLWELREEVLEQQKNSPSKQAPAPSSPVRAPVKNKYGVKQVNNGRDAIYVGFSKDELELRKSGVQGRVIYDEAYKYPDREDLGFFLGAVGGFAGGEAVLKEFAETGELKLRKPGDPLVKKQFSPLTLAFLVIFAAAGGGVLLTSAFDLGDAGVQEIVKAPIDDTTKTLLLVAVSLLGGTIIIGGIRAAAQSVADRMAQGAEVAQKAAINAAFFAAVFLAARAILESS